MKKIIRNAVAASLAALVSFSMISCGDTDSGNDEPVDTSINESDLDRLHDMILPSGTGATIPEWTVADGGVAGLPGFVTGFLEQDEEGLFKKLNGKTNRTQELKDAIKNANETNFFDGKEVKNVIVIFCDGWGESHRIASADYYGELLMDYLPYHAPVNHDSYEKRADDEDASHATWTYDGATQSWTTDGFSNNRTNTETTDSTAGGSAINTGFTTYYSSCGCDLNGREVKNLSELAREKGMLIGNVTNDWLSDATPATVSVHSPKRKDGKILYARLYLSTPDFCMGNDGGYNNFVSGTDSITKILASSAKTGFGLHFKPWFKAEQANIRQWAADLLKEYDGEDISAIASIYDFDDWATKRKVHANTSFLGLMNDLGTTVDKRPLGSFNLEHHFDYTASKTVFAPTLGYKLGFGGAGYLKEFPNYPEMVASTISYLDRKAKAEDRGFFAFIENTCSDGWGHAGKAYDALNETQLFDEGIAIAAKYVLENPDTLLVITADHETGKLTYNDGWRGKANYKKVSSKSTNHSSGPVPVYAFGAGAKTYWGDCVFPDISSWSDKDVGKFVTNAASVYPNSAEWLTAESAQALDPKYPPILRNRTTGIRIAKAMGFNKFGDLNGNGVLDEDTESDSIITYTIGSKSGN